LLDDHKTSILIRVWDGSDREPVLQEVDIEATSGRGLLLIAALSAGCGTYRPEGSTGKVVWVLVEE
jgi:hypothetical protein